MRSELLNELPDLRWRFEVPWREISTLGIGLAPVPMLVEPEDDVQLGKIIAFCAREKMDFIIIGGGSNLCGSDRPLEKLVIRLARGKFTQIELSDDLLIVGAGIKLLDLAMRLADIGFGGLAPLAGIPGTLGGAVVMNAGANGVEIMQYVQRLFGIRSDGESWSAVASELDWAYRSNGIPEGVTVTGAVLKLPNAAPDEKIKIKNELAFRRSREPRGRSAGCTFRNVSSLDPAGLLIDRAGLKGKKKFGFQISERHANYIVNLNAGQASESDYVAFLAEIIDKVAANSGFYLRPEVCFAGNGGWLLANSISRPKIAVIKGGDNSEREVSLRSGVAVATALRNGGYEVEEIDLTTCEVTEAMRSSRVVFPVLHGGWGEGGDIQELMEMENLSFVGSGSMASKLIIDKIAAKKLLNELNIPTPEWAVVSRENRAIPEGLNFPLVLKAPREGSTIGIVKLDDASQWEAALEKEFEFDSVILVERFIGGTEATVAIINGEALPAVEIAPAHGFYDYDAKYLYKEGQTQYFCPPHSILPEVQRQMAKYSLDFYRSSGCRDILRVDFIIDSSGTPYTLEGNTLPGFTATSLVPKAAAAKGISFEKLTSSLVKNHL